MSSTGRTTGMARLPKFSETAAKVGEYYDRLAGGNLTGRHLHVGYWPGERREGTADGAALQLVDYLSDRLGVKPGSRVVDIGCGLGGPALRLAVRRGAIVFGITVSQVQVRQATHLAHEAGLADLVQFAPIDAMCMPYPAQCFDAAWAIESLGHMDRERALGEIARVLRPGARFLIADAMLARGASDAVRREIESHCQVIHLSCPPTAQGYRRLCGQAGLDLTEITDITDRVGYQVDTMEQWLGEGAERFLDENEQQQLTAAMNLQDIPELRYVVISTRRGNATNSTSATQSQK